MRVHLGVLLVRCLPLGVVATVWVAAHYLARQPEILDDRWYVTPEGRLLPLEQAAAPLPAEQGPPAGVVVAARP